MSITAISYDWGVQPTMVRMTTTDTLSAITTAAYWTGQETVIDLLNKGAFTFPEGCLVAIAYSGGQNTFTYDSATAAFVPVLDLGSLIQHVQVDVTLAQFIGSYTASVLLVAAPATGQKIMLQRASLSLNYGGTVLALGGAMHVQYALTANGAGTKATGTLAAATLIAATADTSFGFTSVDTTLTDATTLNQGLYLAMATADFTGGTGSTYKVDVWYSAVTV